MRRKCKWEEQPKRERVPISVLSTSRSMTFNEVVERTDTGEETESAVRITPRKTIAAAES